MCGRVPAMLWVVVLALLFGAGAAAAQPPFTAGQDPAEGARLFAAKGCVRCHAVRGVGGTIGPDLAKVRRPRTFYDLAAAVWNHAPRMAVRMRQLRIEPPRLDPREAGDLAAYLYTLDYFDPRGRVETGRRLFTQKRCVQCHRVGGAGGEVGPRLDAMKKDGTPIALAAAMWNHGPQMAEAMAARKIERPVLAESELTDLIAYINSVAPRARAGPLYVLPGRAEEGRRLFADKHCIDCHNPAATTAQPGPNLVERAANVSLAGFAAAMWNKAPGMTRAMAERRVAVPTLAPEEMADLLAYLYSIRYFAQGGDPHNGARVATNKGCFDCHGLFGERGKPASDLSSARAVNTPAGVLAALWNHSVVDPRTMGERRPWPAFSAADMADLTAYLRGFRSVAAPPTPERR
jgi:mono/diheme cytochrome c family protein